MNKCQNYPCNNYFFENESESEIFCSRCLIQIRKMFDKDEKEYKNEQKYKQTDHILTYGE